MNDGLLVALLVAGVVYGTPLLIAGLGELLAERSGVMNLSVEGMMLMGAVTAFWTSQSLGGPSWIVLLVALAVAAVVGGLMAAAHAFAVVTLRANQIVSGLALAILGGSIGLSSYLSAVGTLSEDPGRHRIQRLDVLGLQDLPLVGPLLFHQDLVVYASWLLVIAVGVYLYRTKMGVNVRAVGEDPKSADAAGIDVSRYRYGHTIAGGVLAGIAGAYYTLAIAPNWTDGLTAGSGWIAIALVICAFWRPGLLLAGAYLFGVVTSLGFTLQARGVDLPPELFSALPYLLTIVAVVIVSSGWARGGLAAPAALGKPFMREDG
jgi:general nucleoside transport system permease protein